MKVDLELQSPCGFLVDLRTLSPSEVVNLRPKEIEKLIVGVGGSFAALGEFFKITYSMSGRDELTLSGATERIVSAGCGMENSRLTIDGDAGPYTGAGMSGGELHVYGNAGDCLGMAMSGGLIRVHGHAGDWCGAARPGQAEGMTGGIIIVDGDTGNESGAGMRRGLLVTGGNCGSFPGFRMLAGTIICLGQLGVGAGLEMKRGSLVAGSSEALLPGFWSTGEVDLEWLRIYLTWLNRFGFPCPQDWDGRVPKRFSGDHLVTGKGEVLVYDILE